MVEAGDWIGRYFVLDTIGHGGMGVVVLAHDPELDRNVAIKLLNPKVRRKVKDAQKRLLREAQAMAALSHPNVLSVLDVGLWEDGVFVAMEFVDGITLREFAEDRPSQSEILRVYIAAARGLAAAHRADLVHRDFKPDNAMIADDGRVLVLDFGLARIAHTEVSSPESSSEETVEHISGPSPESLTDPGAAMGTPVYMAPEQHAGIATPASDQFSFCVSLYEAITGEKPFVGRDVFALAAQKVSFEVRPFPRGISRSLRAALRRGLHPDPEQRFASMDDLIDALERRRRIDPLAAGGLVAVASAVVVGALALRAASAEPCDAAGGPIAQWDDVRRDTVREALLATAVPYAVETTHTVLAELDAHAEELASARHRACTATHEDGTQSEATLDVRVACLDRNANQLGALVGVLEQADRDVVEHAVGAVRSLPPAVACDDVERLPALEDPALAAVRSEIAAAVALLEAGKYQAALDDLDRIAQREGKPLQALVELHRAQAFEALSEFDRAKEAFLVAAEVATSEGDDRTAAQALHGAAWTVGHSQGLPAEGRGHLRSAEAFVERLGSPDDLRADMHLAAGVFAHDEGSFDVALRELEASRALRASPAVLTDLARTLRSLGRSEEAEALLHEAIAMAERDQGEAHPQVAKVLAYLGGLYLETGRNEDALAAHQRELAIFTAALPEDHMWVAYALSNVGGIELYLQRAEPGRAKLEEARRILLRRLGPEHPNIGRLTMNIGEAWRMSGNLERARAEYEASLASHVAALGADHPDTARCRNNLASVLYSSGRYEDAGREYGLALEILTEVLGADHPGLAYPLTGVGQSLIERGAAEEAIPPLERALALRVEDASVDPFDLGDTKLALARALWDSGRDRSRALELGRGARQAYIDAGPERVEARQWAEKWLAERGDAQPGGA